MQKHSDKKNDEAYYKIRLNTPIGKLVYMGDFTQPHQKYAGTGENYN